MPIRRALNTNNPKGKPSVNPTPKPAPAPTPAPAPAPNPNKPNTTVPDNMGGYLGNAAEHFRKGIKSLIDPHFSNIQDIHRGFSDVFKRMFGGDPLGDLIQSGFEKITGRKSPSDYDAPPAQQANVTNKPKV